VSGVPADRLDRRSLLALTASGTAALAGCPAPDEGESEGDADGGTGTPRPTTAADPDADRRLAERFAPTLYFDAAERWFPTDPRPYATERDDDRVVDGFAALDGYTRRREETAVPDPTVFYHVVRYDDSPLAVVQFWAYAAFDQFTANFHWHDWEVLHVFVDTESEDPQLLVASSHSRRVPNNEHLDPDPETVPRVLSELGSHSSALSVNDRPTSFQRLPLGEVPADITNSVLEAVKSLAEVPAAYGLPRDEGLRLPYVVPELDGAPLYEDDRLPAVGRDALVPESLTVRSFDALSSPPTDLPARETGVRLDHAGRAADADAEYALVPTTELEDIDAFVGAQLSFEFAVPEFAEDLVAGHITTAGTPWTQERYDDPAVDITDPAHRAALADRYDAVDDPGPLADLAAVVTEAVQSPDAPEGEGVTTTDTSLETVALLRSDPETIPTFRGVAMARGVEPGDHRLIVNGAGLAPHDETVSVGEGETALAGVEGEIPLVPAGDAVKVEVDAAAVDADLTTLAVDDDFGGRLYEAPVDGPDAVYVHRAGAYTTEVRDADDAVGAFRVNPGASASAVRIDRPRTGKASLASFVAALSSETVDTLGSIGEDDGTATGPPGATGAVNTLGGLLRAIEAVSGAAERAAGRAEAGDRGGADRALEALASNLQRAVERFDGLRGTLPDPVAASADRRFAEARRRTNQAIAAEKL
jgi:hypothetical protein